MALKKPVSVTLDGDNLVWLKARAAAGAQSVSELLDQLVTEARQSGRIGPTRSVVGTIDVDHTDPDLEHADEYVRTMFDRALSRPLVARESSAVYGAPRRRTKRRG